MLYVPMRGGPGINVEKDGKQLAHMGCNNGWRCTKGDPEQKLTFIKDEAKR